MIDSLLDVFLPERTPSTVCRMNGSTLVPDPEMKSGTDVVYCGIGPLPLIPKITKIDSPRSLAITNSGTRNNNSRRNSTHIHQYFEANVVSSTVSSLFLIASQSAIPSGVEVLSNGSVPHATSSSSNQRSPSSSSSELSPIPSPSKSVVSFTSSSKASSSFETPSLSISSSNKSHIISESKSLGTLLLDLESVLHSPSHISVQESLSSSMSALSPIPSKSVSSHSSASSGKSSSKFAWPSLSLSSSRESQMKSLSRSVGTSFTSLASVPHEDSIPSSQPSWSVSVSNPSQTPLSSASTGTEEESLQSEPHSCSSESMNPSPSSSSST